MVTAGAKMLATPRAILKVCWRARRYVQNAPHVRNVPRAPDTLNIHTSITIPTIRTGIFSTIHARHANHKHSARVTQAQVTDMVTA